MAGNSVTLTFAGDSKSLDRTFDNVSKGAKDMASDLDDAGRKARSFDDSVEGISDGLGNSASKFRDTNDLVSGFADTVGLALPPQAQMLMGFADMADGLGGLLAPALAKAKSAMLLLNSTIAANPIGAAIVIIGLLVAAFIIAYKKSETFREIVQGAMAGVRTAFQWVLDKGEQVLGWFKSAPGKIASALAGVAKLITTPYRTAFNFIADAWNNTVGALSFKIPGWVPGIGGNGFDVPNIPHFANGGRFNGGPMVVGEHGPELLVPNVPGHVMTNNQLRGAGGGSGGSINLTINQYDEAGALKRTIQKIVRTDGQGSVQTAFGKA